MNDPQARIQLEKQANLQTITIQSMCFQAPDLFRISPAFRAVEPYLAKATA